MAEFLDFLGVIFACVLLILLLSLIYSLPTMLLWNWLMPNIFGLTKITWVQALGINVLSGILFQSPNNRNSK